MRRAIKRIILRMFPELSGGYHLDRYAIILKICDPPTAGAACDRFRPYWAADIEILTPEGKPQKDFPKYEAVPLPVPAAGPDAGFFLWPRPGTIVTVRWIQGRPDHPVIQHVYPMGLSLPEVPDNMGRWQQRPGVHQTVDPQGHWERKTDKDIKDIAQNIQETAAGSHTRTIEKDSIKSVGGNCTTTISGNSNKTIKGNSNEAVTGPKTVTTSSFKISSPTVVIGAPGDGPSLLPLISKALTDIKDALDILANHTHPNVGTSPSGPDVAEKASGVGGVNSSLESLQE